MKNRVKYLFFFTTLGIFFLLAIQLQKKDPFIPIPLYKLGHSNFHYLTVEIENQIIPALLDTGFSIPFSIDKYFLDKIKNKEQRKDPFCSIDINGNEHKNTHYFVHLIKLANFIEINASAQEEDRDFEGNKITNPNISASKKLGKKTQLPSEKERIDKKIGKIGSKVFKGSDYWCFDFLNSKIYYLEKWEKALKKLHLSLDEFVELSLVKNKSHIVISLDTDFGEKTFILDTAASQTIMKCPSEKYLEHQIVISKKFSANGSSLGKKKIYLFNFPSKFLVDGFLGMDFLKDRVILLDFKHHKIFIGAKKT